MSDRLSPQREAEIADRLAEARRVAAEADWPLAEYQAIKQQQADTNALLAELAAVRKERDQAQKRLHDAAMTRTWRNEDGKKFVFVEDIAPALLGLKPETEAAR